MQPLPRICIAYIIPYLHFPDSYIMYFFRNKTVFASELGTRFLAS